MQTLIVTHFLSQFESFELELCDLDILLVAATGVLAGVLTPMCRLPRLGAVMDRAVAILSIESDAMNFASISSTRAPSSFSFHNDFLLTILIDFCE